ncbi:sirohydrochlorin chelatase [Geomicrobium sp. JCM 19039]|uniref:sirohydrochlorin chelatase n=1 Tax=Geomicrobium sp. JCM 19039 TaxID=1460636 RepID=UPI0005A8A097|nr:sirohydrochlorin chelatase [Geomicrobium sp. JCM 19039]
MQAILYVGHGSRVKTGVQQFERFIEEVMRQMPGDNLFQTYGFIELSAPTITRAIESCIENGARNIAIVPVLLLRAGHARTDIPEEVKAIKRRFPHITFTYGETIGVCEEAVDLAVKRLIDAGLPKMTKDTERIHDVLVVGRGSSDGYQPSDVAKIARLIYERTACENIEICFLAATTPTLEQGIEKLEKLRSEKTYVLPYLLFTGVLMNELDDFLQKRTGPTSYVRCDFLGKDTALAPVIVARAKQALEGQILQ